MVKVSVVLQEVEGSIPAITTFLIIKTWLMHCSMAVAKVHGNYIAHYGSGHWLIHKTLAMGSVQDVMQEAYVLWLLVAAEI